jgi:D-beta-D-heptose 7-phosphate kinase/D-beta-D-heptose 1-phosphate adenosyltransferase
MRDKIKTRKQLQTLVKKLRAKGRRIVFTNGCFDILHIGHVRYLEKAKSLGDILIVALNSDHSVRLIKGPQRPVISEKERAEVIAALGCVDYVILFDEPDPKGLIADLLPDVLVKGGDWSKEKILGSDTVQATGGKVVTIPMVPQVSTTRIINAIIKKYGNTQTHSGTTSLR